VQQYYTTEKIACNQIRFLQIHIGIACLGVLRLGPNKVIDKT